MATSQAAAEDVDFGPMSSADGDLGFHPEDASPASNNPDSTAGADPEGATPSSGKPDAPESDAERRIKELSDKLESLQSDPDYLDARARRLRREMGLEEPAPRVPAAPAAPALPPAPPAPTADQVAAQEQEVLANLGKMPLRTIAQIADEVFRQRSAGKGPTTQADFDTILQQYRTVRSQFPIFRSASAYFDQLVDQMDRGAFIGKSFKEIWGTLQATEDLALGRAARMTYDKSVAVPTNREEIPAPAKAPNMGPAVGAGMVTVTIGKGSAKRQVSVPRDTITLGRAAGLSDKQILDDFLAQESEQ